MNIGRPNFTHDYLPKRNVCCIAAAIIGAGALGAGAQIYGSSQAAKAQTAAQNASINAQMQMFQQAKQLAQPFVDAGSGALPGLQGMIDVNDPNSPLAALLRLTTPGTNMTEALQQTPGFQFAHDWGQKGVQSALAARGLGGPGGALARGASTFATGLANNTWGSVVDRLLSSFGTGTGAMQNLVNTGQNAAAGVGSQAVQTGQGVGSALTGIGNAQAGAAMAQANALGNFGQSGASAAIINKLLGSGGGGSLYGSDIGFGTSPTGWLGNSGLPGWITA